MEQTKENVQPILRELESLPKEKINSISLTVGKIGRRDNAPSPSKFSIYIELNQDLKRLESEQKTMEEQTEILIAKFRNKAFSTLSVSSTNKQTGQIEVTNQMDVFVYGGSRTPLSQIEKILRESLPKNSGLNLVATKEDLLEKNWQFIPDTVALQKYQLTKSQVSEHIRNSLTKSYLKDIYLGDRRLEVYTSQDSLQEGQVERLTFSDLQLLNILSPQFEQIPLSYLGKWQEHYEWRTIERVDGVQNTTLKIEFDPKKQDRESAQKNLETILTSLEVQKDDLRFSLIAPNDSSEESKRWMMTMGVIAVLAIFLILALVLGNLTQIAIVGAAILFGAAGALVALYVNNQILGIMAAVGLLAVAGVSVNSSLILVDAVNGSGASLKDRSAYRAAIIEGSRSRFRPIILTTLTSVLGVFPMAFGLNDESGYTQPIPFVMTWGLSSTCILTLIMIPIFLEMRADFFHFWRWVGNKIFRRQVAKGQNSLQ